MPDLRARTGRCGDIDPDEYAVTSHLMAGQIRTYPPVVRYLIAVSWVIAPASVALGIVAARLAPQGARFPAALATAAAFGFLGSLLVTPMVRRRTRWRVSGEP
jgi:hypothetical protein